MAGALVIFGGHQDREGEAEILREFVRLTGGQSARIAAAMTYNNFSEISSGQPLALAGLTFSDNLILDSR